MTTRLLRYVSLPRSVSEFEERYLARMTRVGLVFLWAHLPAMAMVAALAKTGVWRALAYTFVVLLGPTIGYATFAKRRNVTRIYGVAAMCLGGLLVHFGQGPMQIEMHFYFFVLIALLAVFGDPLVIVVAAGTVTAHHLGLWLLVPASVFNYEASLWTVVVHALFVLIESVGACFVARTFFDNVIGLERIVARRTAELAARGDKMRLVLENVEEGLVMVTPDGVMSRERSAALATLLGDLGDEEAIWDAVGRLDAEAGGWVRVGWDMLREGMFPIDVAIAQLPTRITRGDRTLRLGYRRIGDDDAFEGLLLVVTDISSEVQRERNEAALRDSLHVFERILVDRVGVLQFAAESGDVVAALVASAGAAEVDTPTKRRLHTLKGSAAMFGCEALARLCHEIETHVAETGELSTADARSLDAAWRRIAKKVDLFAGNRIVPWLEVDPDDHAHAIAALRSGSPPAIVAAMLESWTLEPTIRPLARVAEQAKILAARLGKPELVVTTRAMGVRIAPEPLRPVWTALLHAVRNGIDHGIEPAEERVSVGKPAAGHIEIVTRVEGKELVVTVTDDGRGIDWSAVATRARAAGLPADDPAALVAALFADGISTREEITEISGRGVGLGALRAECERLGGSVNVRTRLGEGTSFVIRVPMPVAAPRTFASSPLYAAARASWRPPIMGSSRPGSTSGWS